MARKGVRKADHLRTRLLQARLSPENAEEAESVGVLDDYRARGWDDRRIARESLLALKTQEKKGRFKPQLNRTGAGELSHVVSMLSKVYDLVAKMSDIDWATVRTRGGSGVDLRHELTELRDVDRASLQLFGTGVLIVDDDED